MSKKTWVFFNKFGVELWVFVPFFCITLPQWSDFEKFLLFIFLSKLRGFSGFSLSRILLRSIWFQFFKVRGSRRMFPLVAMIQ